MASNRQFLVVRRAPSMDPAKGMLQFGSYTWPCTLGKNGITTRKSEGDMKTPSGCFQLLFGYYRKDRVRFIKSRLPFKPTNPSMGWCDDQADGNYNRPVRMPFKNSHEMMQRDDTLYDLVIAMDHNFTARIKNRGSAVFFHLTGDKPFTAGCVAIAPNIMKFLIPRLSQNTFMIIKP